MSLPAALGLQGSFGTPAKPFFINSVQQVTITIANGATTGTATITGVVTANTDIVWGGIYHGDSGATMDSFACSITLTNTTTVTATRNTSAVGTLTVQATVVEYTAIALASAIQYGTITLGSTVTTNTATITAVTTANAVIGFLGYTTNNSTTAANTNVPSVELTNTTTVTAKRNTGTGSVTVGFVVINHDPAAIKSIQNRTVALSGTTTSDTDTVTAVKPENSILRYGGYYTDNASNLVSLSSLSLTNATSVTIARSYNTSCARNIRYQVVEYNDYVLKTKKNAATSISSGTSATTTVNSVTTSRAVTFYNGQSIDSGTTTLRSGLEGVTLTNATTITGTRGFSTAAITSAQWDLGEFY